MDVPLFAECHREAVARHPRIAEQPLIYEIIREMMGEVITDLIATTQKHLDAVAPSSIDDVRECGRTLVAFSEEIGEKHQALKRFLMANLDRAGTPYGRVAVRTVLRRHRRDAAGVCTGCELRGRDRSCTGRGGLHCRHD